MKTRITLICLFIISGIFVSNAQSFEGKIVAKLEVLELPESAKGAEGMMSMFNSTSTMYHKGSRTRIEMKLAMNDVIMLMDTNAKEVITLMNQGGQKIALVSNKDQAKSMDNNPMDFSKGKFTITSETKTIAGHPCKKAIWKNTDPKEAAEIEMWYATDMTDMSGEYKGLPGMAMEYTFSMQGMKMKYTVTEIAAQKVDEKLFAIPEGYIRKTPEQMGIPMAPGKK